LVTLVEIALRSLSVFDIEVERDSSAVDAMDSIEALSKILRVELRLVMDSDNEYISSELAPTRVVSD
jgi:hypothetical protein|tara:strand:- start:382 stop:582 length:201 start_codon:yes stop_codon:yes gene_type:complete